VDYDLAIEGGANYYFTSTGTSIHSCWWWICSHLNSGASAAGRSLY
jgi:hypothetical protein